MPHEAYQHNRATNPSVWQEHPLGSHITPNPGGHRPNYFPDWALLLVNRRLKASTKRHVRIDFLFQNLIEIVTESCLCLWTWFVLGFYLSVPTFLKYISIINHNVLFVCSRNVVKSFLRGCVSLPIRKLSCEIATVIFLPKPSFSKPN